MTPMERIIFLEKNSCQFGGLPPSEMSVTGDLLIERMTCPVCKPHFLKTLGRPEGD
jgi:hypothetical protein